MPFSFILPQPAWKSVCFCLDLSQVPRRAGLVLRRFRKEPEFGSRPFLNTMWANPLFSLISPPLKGEHGASSLTREPLQPVCEGVCRVASELRGAEGLSDWCSRQAGLQVLMTCLRGTAASQPLCSGDLGWIAGFECVYLFLKGRDIFYSSLHRCLIQGLAK